MFCWHLHFMKWLLYPPGKKNSLWFFNSLLLQENQKKIRNGIATCKSGIALLFLQEASEMDENILTRLISSSHQTLTGLESKNRWFFLSTQFTGYPHLCMKEMWCLPKQEEQNWLLWRILGWWRWQLSLALRLCSYFLAFRKPLFCIGLKYETVEIIHHSYCKTGTTVCYSCKWFNSNWRTLSSWNHVHFCLCYKATLSLHTAEWNILS